MKSYFEKYPNNILGIFLEATKDFLRIKQTDLLLSISGIDRNHCTSKVLERRSFAVVLPANSGLLASRKHGRGDGRCDLWAM